MFAGSGCDAGEGARAHPKRKTTVKSASFGWRIAISDLHHKNITWELLALAAFRSARHCSDDAAMTPALQTAATRNEPGVGFDDPSAHARRRSHHGRREGDSPI